MEKQENVTLRSAEKVSTARYGMSCRVSLAHIHLIASVALPEELSMSHSFGMKVPRAVRLMTCQAEEESGWQLAFSGQFHSSGDTAPTPLSPSLYMDEPPLLPLCDRLFSGRADESKAGGEVDERKGG